MDEESGGGSILQRIIGLLPILMIGMLIMGMVMYAVTQVVPRYREFDAANKSLQDAQATVTALAGVSDDSEIVILQRQIDRAQTALLDSSSVFMTSDQAVNILDKLYTYAQESGVQITSLLAQQSAAPASSSSTSNRGGKQNAQPTQAPEEPPFKAQAFRLGVDGKIPQLMGFVIRIREAAISGVIITNLDLHSAPATDTLLMDILIYTSPFATGETYTNLPPVEIPPQLVLAITPVSAATSEGNLQTPISAETAAAGGTSTPLPPEASPEPPLDLLLADTFDSGDLSNWNLGTNWNLASEGGGQVLQAKGTSGEVTLTYNTLKDSAVQMRVWLETGGIRLSLRQSASGRYTVSLDALGLVALYRGEKLVQSSYTGPTGVTRWRTLRLSAVQGIIRVSVDDVEQIRYEDPNELPPGTVSISIQGNDMVKVDDVEVRALGSKPTG